jgi:murein DD-endopeptidase MepM/ murein hydrolase activator NlpD
MLLEERIAAAQILEWPSEFTLADTNIIIVNYPDDDSIDGMFKDFQQGTWTYKNHCGTDLATLSFRHSDRGMRVLAAANGTVVALENSQPDRNYSGAGTANYVILDHGGELYTSYLHLRNNSITVAVGDSVQSIKLRRCSTDIQSFYRSQEFKAPISGTNA